MDKGGRGVPRPHTGPISYDAQLATLENSIGAEVTSGSRLYYRLLPAKGNP